MKQPMVVGVVNKNILIKSTAVIKLNIKSDERTTKQRISTR